MRSVKEPSKTGRACHGMTLTEIILVVILIAIIALLLFSAKSNPPRHPYGPRVKVEIASLVAAIKQYEATYDYLPVSTNIPASTAADFTFGTYGTDARTTVTNSIGYQANNSEVVAILLARTQFPDGKPSPNVEHSRNPQKLVFLSVKLVANTNSPGLGSDGVFRDPWGNPYIITLDMNRDGLCRDAFYSQASVSEFDAGRVGHFGLTRADASPTNRNAFEAKSTAMVWSFGPDGKADISKKANQGVNKDNVLSWK